VILIDLDHFKRLNDPRACGGRRHRAAPVGSLLATSVRTVDIPGRYGGEEFLVVLPETGPDAAGSLAELHADHRRVDCACLMARP
jgi:diguanylate cyclase (GGDEF)-like protein